MSKWIFFLKSFIKYGSGIRLFSLDEKIKLNKYKEEK